ncbi:MAG: hypothetical protein H8E35_08275 [Ardenticatenia bacterium]|nr:hypothetical protein [Ardenticatenia bacterium]
MTRGKAVIVGAGALGLGFLVERLAPDYDLWLADVSTNANIDTLRQIEADQGFTVNRCSLQSMQAHRVTGRLQLILADTPEGRPQLDQALAQADLVLTATGRSVLDRVVASIAPTLNGRQRKVWLLFCENGLHIAASYAASFGPQTVLVDTVMSRMCRFDQPQENGFQPIRPGQRLALVIEDYAFLPLDADLCDGGPFSPAFSLVPPAEFRLWEDIKLYLHNGMHAFIACRDFLEGVERFSHTPAWIRDQARRVMEDEVIPAIVRTHAGADPEGVEQYGLDLLERFFSPAFDDSVERGVRGLAEKLAPDERLVGGCTYIRRAGIEPEGYAGTIEVGRQILARDV